ncbi:MAG: hypothetical protein PHQ23_05125 [Candidatus Wallbacteria bacterium]|nr:hypothetical protein [Candidatus Wallbacteria bacterium]
MDRELQLLIPYSLFITTVALFVNPFGVDSFILPKWWLIVCWLTVVLLLRINKGQLQLHRPYYLFLLFVLSFIPSVAAAASPALFGYKFLCLLALCLTCGLFDSGKPASRERIGALLLGLSFLMSLIALLQHYGWIPPRIATPLRMQSTVGNCNFLADFLLFSLLYSLPYASEKWRGYALAAAAFSGLTVIVAAALTKARGPLFSFAVCLVLYGLSGAGNGRKKKAAVSIFLVLPLVFAWMHREYFFESWARNVRVLTNRIGIELAVEKPFFGHGLGQVPLKYLYRQSAFVAERPTAYWIRIAGNAKHIHNEHLENICEGGLAAAGFYALFLCYGLRVLKGTPALYSFVFMQLTMFFNFQFYSPVTALLVLLPFAGGGYFTGRPLEVSRFTSRILLVFSMAAAFIFSSEMIADFRLRQAMHSSAENREALLTKALGLRWFSPEHEYFQRGVLRMQCGEFREAIAEFLAACGTFTDAGVFYNLGVCYRMTGEPMRAVECLEASLWMDSCRKKTFRELAEAYAEINDTVKQEVLSRLFQERFPDESWAGG